MRPSDLALVLIVMVIWGLNFVFAKWGLAQFPPIFMMGLRWAIVAAVLLPFVRMPRKKLAGILRNVGAAIAEDPAVQASMDERFEETFAAVERNFAEVAAALFPGGEGRLRLTEPGADDEEPGIEVELRPAGKRVTRLSLLSGGEKALGAIAFLFALFLARPCPFYLLDEVEAALDDTNIGRFVELLRRYSDRAQFVVITHQKRTMEAADTLYGITMEQAGVSKVVSVRLRAAA